MSEYNFEDSSDIVKMTIIINTPPDDFETICRMPEFFNFCQKTNRPYNPYNRIYAERIEKFYSEFLPFILDEEVTDYKELYDRLRIIEKFIPLYKAGDSPGRTSILDFYAHEGFLMDLKILNSIQALEIVTLIHIANEAASKGHTNILDWIFEISGLLPGESGLNRAYNYPQVWIWGDQHNIYPDEIAADYLCDIGDLAGIQWLEERDVYPTRNGADNAAKKGHYNIVLWLEEKDILPTRSSANFAKENNNIELLEWLQERGITPTARRLFSD